MINKIKSSQSDEHSLNPQSSILNPFQDLKENTRLSTHSIQHKTNNIYLIGQMGAGKSTIGRLLSRELNMAFYDTDRELEHRAGVNISWIYDLEGDEGFRLRETELLKELTQESNVIISTGGGTILSDENRQLLATTGLVIYLYADLSLQVKRTARNQYNRPILRNTNVEERLVEISQERDPLYEALAQVKFHTNKKTPKLVVKEIIKHLLFVHAYDK